MVRKTIPVLSTSYAYTAPLRSTVNLSSLESSVEERSLRVRLSRLALHETQLRQKLSEFESLPERRGDTLSGTGTTVDQEDSSLENSSHGDIFFYPQGLLDQILLEKRILQRRLDALTKNTHDSELMAPTDDQGFGSLVENLQRREIRWEPAEQGDREAAQSSLKKKAVSLTSRDSLESTTIDRDNAKQLQDSSDALLSSRQNVIDQYYRDGNLDSLLESLEQQDKYMEAVMSVLSPSRVSTEGQIKGELVNIRV